MLFEPSYAGVCYLWDIEVIIAQAFRTSLLLTIGFSSSKVGGWLAEEALYKTATGDSPLQNSDHLRPNKPYHILSHTGVFLSTPFFLTAISKYICAHQALRTKYSFQSSKYRTCQLEKTWCISLSLSDPWGNVFSPPASLNHYSFLQFCRKRWLLGTFTTRWVFRRAAPKYPNCWNDHGTIHTKNKARENLRSWT